MPDTAAANIHVDEHARAMADYISRGEAAALALGNRGPIRLDDGGKLDPAILDAWHRTGFYVFEGVIGDQELAELRQEFDDVLSRAPVEPEAEVDAEGRPAFGHHFERPPYRFTKPLSDPVGGTTKNNGRHPVAMVSPKAADDAPEWTVHMLDGNLQILESALRLYGNPGMLKVAEAILGPDFVPYNEVVFIKEPGLGPSVAWHQDGTTHWSADDWHDGAHGYNSMAQLYDCTAGNCVWVLPGSHKMGPVDIKGLDTEEGSDRLTDVVPMVCKAGDVVILNRQMVHGSFANSSPDRRVTLNAGFFSRSRLLNVTTQRLNGVVETYDQARIDRRSRIIPLAIDARRQAFPDETPYVYQPLAGQEDAHRWNEKNRQAILHNYNLDDMFI